MPKDKTRWEYIKEKKVKNKVPLMEGNEIVEYPANQATLTKRYFDRAIDFVERNKENSFFLYITPAMPHVPLFASDKFKGTSERGLYGDVIEEIDANVGRLLEHLKKQGLAENTFVIYTSDNGPWLSYKEQGGSAAPLRDGKFTNYEGGVREPCVMWWPGKIPGGSESDAIISTIDLLPTLASLAGAKLPQQTIIDGVDHSSFIQSPSETGPRTQFFFNSRGKPEVYGVREGEWKYLRQGGKDRKQGPELYNLENDISESENLIEQHPEKVKKLDQLIEHFQ